MRRSETAGDVTQRLSRRTFIGKIIGAVIGARIGSALSGPRFARAQDAGPGEGAPDVPAAQDAGVIDKGVLGLLAPEAEPVKGPDIPGKAGEVRIYLEAGDNSLTSLAVVRILEGAPGRFGPPLTEYPHKEQVMILAGVERAKVAGVRFQASNFRNGEWVEPYEKEALVQFPGERGTVGTTIARNKLEPRESDAVGRVLCSIKDREGNERLAAALFMGLPRE